MHHSPSILNLDAIKLSSLNYAPHQHTHDSTASPKNPQFHDPSSNRSAISCPRHLSLRLQDARIWKSSPSLSSLLTSDLQTHRSANLRQFQLSMLTEICTEREKAVCAHRVISTSAFFFHFAAVRIHIYNIHARLRISAARKRWPFCPSRLASARARFFHFGSGFLHN